MRIKPFSYEEHIYEVKKWAEKRTFPLPGKEFLSELGLIVNDAAVGFLYTSNSKIGWIEWVIGNPEKTPEERKEAIDILFQALEKLAIVHGIKALFSSSASGAYQSILERNGFAQTDSNVTHYIKGIS